MTGMKRILPAALLILACLSDSSRIAPRSIRTALLPVVQGGGFWFQIEAECWCNRSRRRPAECEWRIYRPSSRPRGSGGRPPGSPLWSADV